MLSSLKVAIQMDPPAQLKPEGDSTVALALEAQARGHLLWYYTPQQLCWRDDALFALGAQTLSVDEELSPWYRLGEPEDIALEEMDVVLMRQDPPFDLAYFSATYLLERLQKTRVINPPAYVRNHPEKLAILSFPEYIPPTLVSANEQAITAFAQAHGTIIAKPLYGFGGYDIYRFAHDDPNLVTFLESYRGRTGEPLMLQAFLPQVAQQDVRVVMIGGKVSAAVGRRPAEGSIRANFRAGGTAMAVELSDRQQQICDIVGKELAQSGVLFAGLDLIGDYLTEINITSPTGIRAAQALYGHDPAQYFWDAVETA